jgi:hypothetical protein
MKGICSRWEGVVILASLAGVTGVAGVWNETSRQLCKQLGMKVPLEALQEIRRIRGGSTEIGK